MPQVEFADVVIRPYTTKKIKDLGNSNEILDICYELTVNIPISLDPYYEIISQFKGIKLDYKYTENGSQNIDISGEVTPEEIEQLNTFNKRFLDDIGIVSPNFPKGVYGLVVSILIYIVINKDLY